MHIMKIRHFSSAEGLIGILLIVGLCNIQEGLYNGNNVINMYISWQYFGLRLCRVRQSQIRSIHRTVMAS